MFVKFLFLSDAERRLKQVHVRSFALIACNFNLTAMQHQKREREGERDMHFAYYKKVF